MRDESQSHVKSIKEFRLFENTTIDRLKDEEIHKLEIKHNSELYQCACNVTGLLYVNEMPEIQFFVLSLYYTRK